MQTARQIAELSQSKDQPITLWSSSEDRIQSGPTALYTDPRALTLSVPYDLSYRRIYWHVEPTFTGYGPDEPPDYIVQMEWRFQRNGRPIAILPASIGADSLATYLDICLPKICTASTDVVVSEGLEIVLSKRFKSAVRRLSLSPYRITCQADEAVLAITRTECAITTITSLRVWLGILSSNMPI